MITPQEAREILKQYLDMDSEVNSEYLEAQRMAIKALEQQPCEDAISRAALLEELGEEPFNWNDSPEEFQEVRDYQWFKSLVENAPSVAPETKTGHWIRQTDDYHDYYECEHCGIAVGLDDIRNYCPNCGATMEVDE